MGNYPEPGYMPPDDPGDSWFNGLWWWWILNFSG